MSRRSPAARRFAAVAVAVTAIGFYLGVRVEKRQLPSTTTGSAPAATASRDRVTSGSGDASTGTVVRVDGDTIYVKDGEGKTIEVKVSRLTTIDKSQTVGRGRLNPGDSVVVAGSTGSDGEVSASSITDSGSS